MQGFRGYPVKAARLALAGRSFDLLVPTNGDEPIRGRIFRAPN